MGIAPADQDGSLDGARPERAPSIEFMSLQNTQSAVGPSSTETPHTSWQAPAGAGADAPSDAPSPERRGRAVASSWGFALALIALLGSIATMAFVGLTVVPMETASGYHLSDTPAWYQTAVLGAFGSLLLWTVMGTAAIVLGIVGLVGNRGTIRGVLAIVLSVVAPLLVPVVLSTTMAVDIAQL